MVRWLIKEGGADVNGESVGYCKTPLHLVFSSHVDRLQKVRVLLEHMPHNADINKRTNEGDTPLLCASRSHDDDDNLVVAARLLLERGADANLPNYDGFTPVFEACLRGHFSLLRLLVEQYGADINVKFRWGDSPLIYMSRQRPRQINFFQYLLEHGASVTAIDQYGETALHVAVTHANPELARLLLEHGASATTMDVNGVTALHTAAEHGNPELARLLLEHGASATAMDHYECKTVLHRAARHANPELARLLLEHGASVTAMDKNGVTALHMAVGRGYFETSRLLLEHGASVTAMDENGATALQMAVRNDHYETSCLLLKNGAGANQRDLDGLTMLHYCILHNRVSVKIMQALLESGANTKLVNREGKAPFVVACEKGLLSAVYLLLQKGAGDGSISFVRHLGRKRRGRPSLLDSSNGDS